MTIEIIQAIEKIRELMNWSLEQACAWMDCPNLNFGDASPVLMIVMGKGKKVFQFIECVKEGNFP